MTSITEIYNQALANLGVTRFVSDVSDQTLEAEICGIWFGQVRDEILRMADWPFARRRVVLAEVANPPDHWEYQYRYPSDCLFLRALLIDGVRNPRHDQRIEFEIGADDTGRVIWTDQSEAVALYTRVMDTTTFYDPLFVSALAWGLAARIAMPLAVDARLSQMAGQQYSMAVQRAAAAAFNEGFQAQPESALVAVRFGGY